MIYIRGELQSEIQYDQVKEFCKKQKINFIDYEISNPEDMESAKGFFKSFPPFYDLGQLNIRHYQISTDIGYNNHIATTPTLKMFVHF